MNEEQEGIVLETGDLEQEGIALPLVENDDQEVEVETNETETNTNPVQTEVDDEKESLKRGVNKERKARKEAEKKNKELEARIKALEDAQSQQAPVKTTAEELIESGVDEGIAKSIAAAIDKKQDSNSNLEKELADVKFENSLNKKSKEEGFEDIVDYADEIKELVDKGLTIEQSYYAATYDKSKTQDTKSEIERKVEAKIQNNQARKNILGNYNNDAGTVATSKAKTKATSEEKAMAAAVGMTVEEYAAYRDMDSVKDYNKYNAAKKK